MEQSIRAIIIKNKELLLIHRIKEDDDYFVFPGGKLEGTDASLEFGLKRECKEELGVDINIEDLFYEEMFDFPTGKQKQLFYFCDIVGGELGTGEGPEFTRDPLSYGTYKLQWIPISDIANKNIKPFKIRDMILQKFN